MKRLYVRMAILGCIVVMTLVAPLFAETAQERDRRMAWWREARFGLFIHWGLYAIPAGEWNGKTNYGEWIRNNAQIPLEEYDKFVKQFNPVKFNADEWVRMARDAGMKYIVITSKHHDGFCLFDSKQTDFDVMSTPFRRDILKELSEAAQRAGITLCFYHSIMDWHHPDYLPRRPWEKEKRPVDGAVFDRYVDYMKAQLRELLTGYGPIGVLWFDGQWENTWTHERGLNLYEYVRGLQPKIIVNNRVDVGRGGDAGMTTDARFAGDFGTPEQEIPATGLPGADWESCMTMNDNWGYNKNDRNWKSGTQLIRMLADTASKGGNLLLNVGPTAEGEFPAASVERLRDIGRWMNVNGQAIYGTQASPLPSTPWGRCTRKALEGGDTRLYLHVFDWPRDGRLAVGGLLNEPRRAFLLATGEAGALPTRRDRDGLVISLPEQTAESPDSVVVLDIAGSPRIGSASSAGTDPSIVTPQPRQIAWQELEFTAFVHFGMNTFTNREWGDGKEDPALFNPAAFDARQWTRAFKAAGIKLVLMVAKHHDGFCLWPSRYTEHSVKNSPWKNGKGDAVREVAEACRAEGLKFGIYLSPWDRHEPSYGDSPRYNQFYKNQLTELLTQYGPIHEVWFDGANGEGPNGKRQVYDWDGYIELIRRYQPEAVIFSDAGPDVRWVGNERGFAGETNWSMLRRAEFYPGTPNYRQLTQGHEDGTHWVPAECDVSIRPGWFYHPDQDAKVKSLSDLLEIYYGSVGRNALMLLNVPADTRGLLHENDVARLAEFRAVLDETFKENLAAGKKVRISWPEGDSGRLSTGLLTDGDWRTALPQFTNPGALILELDLGREVEFDRIALREDIRSGQRVRAFALEYYDGQDWKEAVKGTTIGFKRLLRTPLIRTSMVRLKILDSRASPLVSEIGLYRASPREVSRASARP